MDPKENVSQLDGLTDPECVSVGWMDQKENVLQLDGWMDPVGLKTNVFHLVGWIQNKMYCS